LSVASSKHQLGLLVRSNRFVVSYLRGARRWLAWSFGSLHRLCVFCGNRRVYPV